MPTRRPDLLTTSGAAAELDRLGDEIAELSAQLEAAAARRLDLMLSDDGRHPTKMGGEAPS